MSTPSDEQPTAETSPPQEPSAATPPGPAGPPGPPPPNPYAMFGPVPRPPRVPWVNPDRRMHLLAAGTVAALILIGAGFGIGYAVAPSGDHHRPMYRDGYGPMMRGGIVPGWMAPGLHHPHFPYPGNPSATAAPPTPSPSSS